MDVGTELLINYGHMNCVLLFITDEHGNTAEVRGDIGQTQAPNKLLLLLLLLLS